MADTSFERLGVRPAYVAESRSEFADWRQRLKTESGLVIANHPGGVDALAVMKALERKYVYFIAAEKNVERFKDVVGEERLLPAAKDLGELRAMMRRVGAILEQGGVVFLFPTGGADAGGGRLAFKSGLGYLLKSMNPEQMVYAFHISPEDTQKAFSGGPSGAKVASAMIAGDLGVRAVLKADSVIRIDERYTRAGEWQRLLDHSAGSQAARNERLAGHYAGLFGPEGTRS